MCSCAAPGNVWGLYKSGLGPFIHLEMLRLNSFYLGCALGCRASRDGCRFLPSAYTQSSLYRHWQSQDTHYSKHMACLYTNTGGNDVKKTSANEPKFNEMCEFFSDFIGGHLLRFAPSSRLSVFCPCIVWLH